MIRKSFLISGKVQGVWYRKHALEKAKALGLAGFVQNTPEGNVYAEAQGSEQALTEFEQWCRKGPVLARVKDIISSTLELREDNNFIIK